MIKHCLGNSQINSISESVKSFLMESVVFMRGIEFTDERKFIY